MAKLTNLLLLNEILKRIGEPIVTGLTSLTGIQLVAWDSLQEAIMEIASLGHWIPLEVSSTFAMVTGTNTYAIPTDMMEENIHSFRCPDNDDNIEFITPKEWDLSYPKGIGTDTTGYPTAILRYEDYFHLNKYPAAAQNTKKIYYRYWKRPPLLQTATTTGSATDVVAWFPEGSERTVLVNLATYKVLVYKNSPEAPEYYARVFGRPGGVEGTLDIMRRQYIAPAARVKPLVTYPFLWLLILLFI